MSNMPHEIWVCEVPTDKENHAYFYQATDNETLGWLKQTCYIRADVADNQADIESKNMLRKARDAASERALKYAAKAGELELENAALKIRLEQEGIEV